MLANLIISGVMMWLVLSIIVIGVYKLIRWQPGRQTIVYVERLPEKQKNDDAAQRLTEEPVAFEDLLPEPKKKKNEESDSPHPLT